MWVNMTQLPKASILIKDWRRYTSKLKLGLQDLVNKIQDSVKFKFQVNTDFFKM